MNKAVKTSALLLILAIPCAISFGQQKEAAEKLVNEGIAAHDRGVYDSAVMKYDLALELDKDNILALAEKAMTLLKQQKTEEAIQYCKRALKAHPDDKELRSVYVTYGTAMDELNDPDRSVKVYNEGIKKFPDYYMLHFNKGITLFSIKKYDDAMESLERAVELNPAHPGSHNAIARIAATNGKRVPAMLAYCRFLTLEAQGNRAQENLTSLQKIMKGNVQQTGERNVTISISTDMLNTGKKTSKDNFSTIDLMLSLSAGLDYDDKNKSKTPVEQFIRKIDVVCSSLGEKGREGFFWKYYAPYFAEMKDKDLVTTFSYIAFASTESQDVMKWLDTHQEDVARFLEWSQSFMWKAG